MRFSISVVDVPLGPGVKVYKATLYSIVFEIIGLCNTVTKYNSMFSNILFTFYP